MNTIFPVLTEPTPSLRERSLDVSVADITTPVFQTFLDDLAQTMQVKDGVGIAAPQVGKNIRAIVVTLRGRVEWLINPIITKTSEQMEESEEGCLSVPGVYGIVMRHKKISVEAINRHGRRVLFDAKKFDAVVMQHEVDHLDGILFVDKAVRIVKNGRHI